MKEETGSPDAVAQLYLELQGHDHFRGEVASSKYSKDSIMGLSPGRGIGARELSEERTFEEVGSMSMPCCSAQD